MKTMLMLFMVSILFIGCTTPLSQRASRCAMNDGKKVIYLTHVDSIPKSTADLLAAKIRTVAVAMTASTNGNVNTKAMDPVVLAALLDQLFKVAPELAAIQKDIRINTATRSVELYIKDYDMNGTNIEGIVKSFKEITSQIFPSTP